MTPTDTSTTSDQPDDPSSILSVLDFLYHDSRRIGSFLAQFEGDGHLQQLTRTKDGTRGKKDTSKSEGKGNLGFASGKLESSGETSLSMTEGYARVFDPYWANARAFLDHLSENGMLNREWKSSEVGQFVLVKGHLSILDLGMMKEAWKIESIRKKIFGESNKSLSQMTAAQKVEHKEKRENSQLMLDMMQVMPHAVQASILTDDEEEPALVWATLREEYLVQPASEITLAHGTLIPGVWSVVGILTAQPEFVVPDFDGDLDGENIGTMSSMVGAVSKLLAPLVRFALGRPAFAHAVTPLLIFREVV